MRKSIILLLCVLFLGNMGIRAQDDEPIVSGGGFMDNLSYGAKIGLVSSTFATDFQKLANIESRTGLAVGIFGEYKILDYLGATVEVLYVQEGTMRLDPRYVYYNTRFVGNNFTLTKVNSNILLHNIEIPVMVDYYLPEMGNIKLKAFAGASFDYILQAKARNLISVQWAGQNYESIVLSERAVDDVTSSFQYYSIGAIIGAGVTYDMFTLDVSFKWGLTPINNLATFNYQNNNREDFSTNTFMIKLGLNLNKLF